VCFLDICVLYTINALYLHASLQLTASQNGKKNTQYQIQIIYLHVMKTEWQIIMLILQLYVITNTTKKKRQ
jgi:hypothetical protein